VTISGVKSAWLYQVIFAKEKSSTGTQQMAKKQKMQFSHPKTQYSNSAFQIAVLSASLNKCS